MGASPSPTRGVPGAPPLGAPPPALLSVQVIQPGLAGANSPAGGGLGPDPAIGARRNLPGLQRPRQSVCCAQRPGTGQAGGSRPPPSPRGRGRGRGPGGTTRHRGVPAGTGWGSGSHRDPPSDTLTSSDPKTLLIPPGERDGATRLWGAAGVTLRGGGDTCAASMGWGQRGAQAVVGAGGLRADGEEGAGLGVSSGATSRQVRQAPSFARGAPGARTKSWQSAASSAPSTGPSQNTWGDTSGLGGTQGCGAGTHGRGAPWMGGNAGLGGRRALPRGWVNWGPVTGRNLCQVGGVTHLGWGHREGPVL